MRLRSGCSQTASARCQVLIDFSAESEISQLSNRFTYQNIFRLDISVDHMQRLKNLQCQQHLVQDFYKDVFSLGKVLRSEIGFYQAVQSLLTELKNKRDNILCLEVLNKLYNEWTFCLSNLLVRLYLSLNSF